MANLPVWLFQARYEALLPFLFLFAKAGRPVGNRTYIRLISNATTATNRTVILSDGLQVGQLLMIENGGASGAFAVGDAPAITNANTAGQRQMGINDLITLIWNGTDWLEQSFADK